MTYSDQSLIHKIKNEILARPQVKLRDIAEKLQIERHRIEKAVRVCKGTSFRDYRRMLRTPDLAEFNLLPFCKPSADLFPDRESPFH